MTRPEIRPFAPEHRDWARALLAERWGSARIVTRGRLHQADALPGFIALADGRPAGLVTYLVEGDACEVVTLDACESGAGVGTALLEAAAAVARAAGCRRLWLVTTNDNARALRFYQRRGFRIVAVHVDAVRASRRLKPEIPETGDDGIPIRDEIELELAPL
jgi:ribosomal protein S18 acetylase RimI-like enzyme